MSHEERLRQSEEVMFSRGSHLADTFDGKVQIYEEFMLSVLGIFLSTERRGSFCNDSADHDPGPSRATQGALNTGDANATHDGDPDEQVRCNCQLTGIDRADELERCCQAGQSAGNVDYSPQRIRGN